MPFDRKALLALLRVLGQRSVSKSKAPDRTMLVDYVNNPATVKRPKPKMLDDYCNSFAGLNGSSRPAELDAWDIEHLPSMQRLRSSVECCGTLA